MIAFCWPEWSRDWEGSSWNKRGDVYLEFKERISKLAVLYRLLPYFEGKGHVLRAGDSPAGQVFRRLAHGSLYGTAMNEENLLAHRTWLRPQTRQSFTCRGRTPGRAASSPVGCSRPINFWASWTDHIFRLAYSAGQFGARAPGSRCDRARCGRSPWKTSGLELTRCDRAQLFSDDHPRHVPRLLQQLAEEPAVELCRASLGNLGT